MLKKEGNGVETAADGFEAIDLIRKKDISVVVTDLKMPRLGGIGLLRRVMEKHPSVPVIIITAHGPLKTPSRPSRRGPLTILPSLRSGRPENVITRRTNKITERP
jgi:DNA-binding NtrC family response regulator